MRINEYNNLQDFINEYDGKFEIGDEFSMGIEFKYKDKEYRMCREPNASNKFYLYYIVIPFWVSRKNMTYETLGIYDTIEELLASTAIDNRPFSEVIMDDNTYIESKD